MKAIPRVGDLAWLRLLLFALAPAVAAAAATEDADAVAASETAMRYTASLETWIYGTGTRLNSDSVLNPGNRIARIPAGQALLDARLNLRAENGPVQALLSPRLVEEQDSTAQATAARSSSHVGSARIGQAYLRIKSQGDSLTVGRELFSWGPANFRSPSNPFYFDAGRTNPLAATPGIDLVRYTLGRGPLRATAAYVFSTSQVLPAEDLSHTALLKIDQQGKDYLVSLVASKRRGDAAFVGGFAQYTPDDAWLLYAEFGSSRQPAALSPATTPGPFYTLQQPAPRSLSDLIGASYTLESGNVLAAELLHNSGGYTRSQENQYFQQALAAGALAQLNPAAGYGALGQALGFAPRLLGRDYLWLSWQSNPQDSKFFWRAEWSANLRDGSGQALLYAEKNFVPRVSGFVALTHSAGGVQTDYGSLVRARLTLGLKLFVF
jgi:hypothetical protein